MRKSTELICYFHHAISKVLFINMNYKWWFWLCSPGWGNVVRLTHTKISWFFPLSLQCTLKGSPYVQLTFLYSHCAQFTSYVPPYEGRIPIVCKLYEILHGICIFSLVYYFVQLFIYLRIDSWMLIFYFTLELSTTSFFLSFFLLCLFFLVPVSPDGATGNFLS